MDAVVFSESATPRRRSVRLQANSIQDSVSNSQKRKTATSASRTPKRHKSDEATVTPLRKKGSTTPSSSRQAPRSQTRSSGMKGGSKTENHRPGSYGIAQLSDGDLDWATMIPPQPKFQLARTPPVKRNDDGVKANAGDDSNTTQQQLREVSSSELNIAAGNTDITTTSTATLPVDTSVVTSKEAAVIDRVDDVAEEVDISTVTS
ncbi:serine/arginine repetitive matrix protein 2-like [Dysidea avara]|uniref:serine/arginine repetitive matrix protein 2-like n=1 Tax=Dysidea avara TaxID=196820 RepID=UPI0033209F90